MIRKRCASVISAKTAPVVMIYAFKNYLLA
jgi:hypothetical protein